MSTSGFIACCIALIICGLGLAFWSRGQVAEDRIANAEMSRDLEPEPELCGHCGEVALGYARLADGTRVCHGDERSCYNDRTYRGKPAPPAFGLHPHPGTRKRYIAEAARQTAAQRRRDRHKRRGEFKPPPPSHLRMVRDLRAALYREAEAPTLEQFRADEQLIWDWLETRPLARCDWIPA